MWRYMGKITFYLNCLLALPYKKSFIWKNLMSSLRAAQLGVVESEAGTTWEMAQLVYAHWLPQKGKKHVSNSEITLERPLVREDRACGWIRSCVPVAGNYSAVSVLLFLHFWQVLENSFVINQTVGVHHKAVISWINLLRKYFLNYCSKLSQPRLHFFLLFRSQKYFNCIKYPWISLYKPVITFLMSVSQEANEGCTVQ